MIFLLPFMNIPWGGYLHTIDGWLSVFFCLQHLVRLEIFI